jgi:glycosyltransferase involved in cell wall biosynthesis
MKSSTDLSPLAIDGREQTADAEVEITLVVPVYNEEENIVPFVREVKATLTIPYQIVVVFDRDEDSTIRKQDDVLRIDPTVAFVRNTAGVGVINAFRTGFDVARTRYVVPIMADLSDTPATIIEMYRKMHEGFDLVIGSRYCEGGRKIGGPYIKYLLSLAANLSLRKLTKIPTHDMTNAFILYRKEVLDNIYIRSSGGFEVTMELIAKAYILGYRITEVPTVNRERAAGKSNFRLIKWIRNYLYWYFYILIYSIVRRINAHYVRDTQKP